MAEALTLLRNTPSYKLLFIYNSLAMWFYSLLHEALTLRFTFSIMSLFFFAHLIMFLRIILSVSRPHQNKQECIQV